MDLLEDLKISLLNFDFIMIYIIHKMFLLFKNQLNYLKNSIFEFFLRSTVDLLLEYTLELFFFITYNNEKLKP